MKTALFAKSYLFARKHKSLLLSLSVAFGLGLSGCHQDDGGGLDLEENPEAPEAPLAPATVNGAPVEEAIFHETLVGDFDGDEFTAETRSLLLILVGRAGKEDLCTTAARAKPPFDQAANDALDELTEAAVLIETLEDGAEGEGIVAGETLTCCVDGAKDFLAFDTAAKLGGLDAVQLFLPPGA